MRKSSLDHIPEPRILAVPHDVICAPCVVKQAGVNSAAEVGLFVRKQQRRPLAQRYHGRVQRLDGKVMWTFSVLKSLRERVHMSIAGGHYLKRRHGFVRLVQAPALLIRGLGIEGQPQRLGQPGWRLSKPGHRYMNRWLRLGQQQFDKHFPRERSTPRLKCILVLEFRLDQDAVRIGGLFNADGR